MNRYKPVKRYGIVKSIIYTKNRPQRVVYLDSDVEEGVEKQRTSAKDKLSTSDTYRNTIQKLVQKASNHLTVAEPKSLQSEPQTHTTTSTLCELKRRESRHFCRNCVKRNIF